MSLSINQSPFDEAQLKLLQPLVASLTAYQKAWLAGYLSATITEETTSVASTTTATKSATILYASQTGNSQQLAEALGEKLRLAAVDANVVSTAKFKTNQLKKIDNLIIIASTHGEGEPPDNAIPFYEFLHSSRAPKLTHLNYAVLSLGDSSYEFFCKTGADFDAQLAKLGAKRLTDRVDCDVAYEEDAARFYDSVLQTLAASEAQEVVATTTAVSDSSDYSKQNPFYAEVVEKIVLNGQGSNKHTVHLELAIEDANFSYEPGDSVGIFPTNHAELVHKLVTALQFDDAALKEQLATKEITTITKPLFEKIRSYTTNETFLSLDWKTYHYGHDLLDIVQNYGPFTWTAEQFINLLRDIPARLYSIASSQKADEDIVALTISKVAYETDGRDRLGVCSGAIAETITIGDKLPIYIHHNPNFALPADEAPIIMIGAGTGVAPFRSFIEERAELGLTGNAWLFFGNQHFVTDFLYQTDWQQWVEDGALSKISLAFSRDGEEKVYVQHKLQQNAEELYDWLQSGAIIYVCGDKSAMASDVDKALHKIVQQQGKLSASEAENYINELKQNGRYQRDVY